MQRILKYVTELQYLGLTVRERLNFNYHLRSVKEKLSKSVGAVKRILRVDYELGRKAVRVIYKGLFTPCVLYGAAVSYHFVVTSHCRRNILKLQRIALLACLAVYRTISTDALHVLAGTMPSDLEAIRVAIIYKVKRGLALTPSESIVDLYMSSSLLWCKR